MKYADRISQKIYSTDVRYCFKEIPSSMKAIKLLCFSIYQCNPITQTLITSTRCTSRLCVNTRESSMTLQGQQSCSTFKNCSKHQLTSTDGMFRIQQYFLLDHFQFTWECTSSSTVNTMPSQCRTVVFVQRSNFKQQSVTIVFLM